MRLITCRLQQSLFNTCLLITLSYKNIKKNEKSEIGINSKELSRH